MARPTHGRLTGRKGVTRRKRWLRGQPLCVHCLAEGFMVAAEEVDHVIPLARGGKEASSNLQSLCRTHHELKTRRDLGQRGRVQTGADGWPVVGG